MDLKDAGGWNWILSAFYVLFAAIGGALGGIMRRLEAKQEVKFWAIALEGAVSAFAGMLIVLLCQAMELSWQWTGVVVGVCGWIGGRATMTLLERIVTRKIGADQ